VARLGSNYDKALRAVLRVGDGRGFVVGDRRVIEARSGCPPQASAPNADSDHLSRSPLQHRPVRGDAALASTSLDGVDEAQQIAD
jgi:hypothetical protein